jgi:hypothetical protein
MGGAILLVSALIFGALAGGVVIQRLNANPAASSEQQTGETGGNGQPKAQTNESNNGQDDAQNENESQDKDA